MNESPEHAPLDYAPVAPANRWRRVRRIGLFLICFVIAGSGVRWGASMLGRGKLLYHQRNCLHYALGPDVVVFDSDPVRVTKLAGDPDYLISGGCAWRKPPADWVAMRPPLSFVSTPTAMIFLHELKTSTGTRLVEVERTGGANESPLFLPGYDVDAKTLVPGTLSQPRARELLFGNPIDVLDGIGPFSDIRIYAGQIDPADASHFTIRYEHLGKTSMVDGYLRPDGRIDLTRR